MPPISDALGEALNDQIQLEISSAYLYLGMSICCDARNLGGAAHWLRLQFQEELGHATRLIDYLGERGNRATLKAIPEPSAEFDSLLQVFEKVLAHEQEVTASIYRLCDRATEERDYATQAFLQWYVTEQVEEEREASEIVETLKLAGEKGSYLLVIDKQLGQRGAE